jgi:hypothetical protein
VVDEEDYLASNGLIKFGAEDYMMEIQELLGGCIRGQVASLGLRVDLSVEWIRHRMDRMSGLVSSIYLYGSVCLQDAGNISRSHRSFLSILYSVVQILTSCLREAG